MFELPFPDSKKGWAAAILLSVVVFIFYYVHIYQALYEFNSKRLIYNKTYTLFDDVYLRLSYPKYYISNMERWMPIQIINYSDHEVKDLDIKLIYNYSSSEDEEKIYQVPKIYFKPLDCDLRNIYSINGNVLSNYRALNDYFTSYHIEKIQSGETLTKFIRHDSEDLMGFEILFDEEDLKVDFVSAQKPFKALIYIVMVNLLLPPWANGLIPIISLITIWFVEKNPKNSEDEPNNNNDEENKSEDLLDNIKNTMLYYFFSGMGLLFLIMIIFIGILKITFPLD